MTAHEQIRAMLDELMGTCRDGEASQNRVRFDDPRVCKSFLLGCCPHDVLANTRMDLGNCPNVHDPALRADYETASKNKDFFYDIDSMEHLQSFIIECDLKTEIAKRRLRETQAELSEEANIKSNRINALGEQIGTLMAKAEEIGATGEVEQTLKMMEEVEALKVKKVQAEIDLKNSLPVSTYQQQKLRVCEVCGAFLGVHDNDRRLADHFGGKLHLGFISIREKLEALKVRIPERKAQRDIVLEELRLKRELQNAQKQKIQSVSDRSRSRSLSSSDYEQDSERSSREYSRDHSFHSERSSREHSRDCSSNSERTSREHSRDHSFHSEKSSREHSKDRSFHVSKSTSSSYSKKKHKKRAPLERKSSKRKSKQNLTRSRSRSRSRSSQRSRSSSWRTRRSRSRSWSTRRSRSSSQVSRSSSQQSYCNTKKSRQSHHSKSRNNKKHKYQRYSRSRSGSRYSRSRSRSWDRTYKNGTSSDSD